jgi:hypothetical protein
MHRAASGSERTNHPLAIARGSVWGAALNTHPVALRNRLPLYHRLKHSFMKVKNSPYIQIYIAAISKKIVALFAPELDSSYAARYYATAVFAWLMENGARHEPSWGNLEPLISAPSGVFNADSLVIYDLRL